MSIGLQGEGGGKISLSLSFLTESEAEESDSEDGDGTLGSEGRKSRHLPKWCFVFALFQKGRNKRWRNAGRTESTVHVQ